MHEWEQSPCDSFMKVRYSRTKKHFVRKSRNFGKQHNSISLNGLCFHVISAYNNSAYDKSYSIFRNSLFKIAKEQFLCII